MNKLRDPICWAEIVTALNTAEAASADHERFVGHLSTCAQCRRAYDALDEAGAFSTADTQLDPVRSQAIRSRLIARAVEDRRKPVRSAAIGRWSDGLGWIMAAGLATLLFTHHAFHRPLALGWMVAGILGILCFGIGLHAYGLRREIVRLKDRFSLTRGPEGVLS